MALKVKAAFADLFTVSGGSGGTRFNASGIIEAANAPAFDYNPSTLALRGLMARPQVTNLFLNSEVFTAGTNTTVTSNATTAPDNAATADLLLETTANGEHYAADRSITVVSGTQYTYMLFVKRYSTSTRSLFLRTAGTGGSGTARFDIVAGTPGAVSGIMTGAKMVALPNGWFACVVTVTAAASGSMTVRVQVHNGTTTSYTGTTADGFYVWGGMFHAGVETSYVACGASATTRTADNIKIDGTRFSQMFKQGEGTLFVRFMPNAFSGSAGANSIAAIHDGTVNNRIQLAHGATGAMRAFNAQGGTTNVDTATANLATALAANTYALSFKNNEVLLCLNGGAVVSDTSCAIATAMTTLQVGANWTNTFQADGWIQDLQYIPKATPAAELPALATRIANWRTTGVW